ncbi:tetrahydrobiopterin biosynthesis enzymes-like protein [Pisolithus orientalis]|uniref:tetrahydrobiopterin biosynthesis enzymes-like protein n=1 Tax=Pisolithus orientalis TaxID=936130 RepID=UPI0022249220|nr:tetrahydrobiopterin biosynthesis enzymes-like protein [Pisolithus orientalis]KAI6002297.1 tetrahydrobiopterin biosynthesis enzymes-like protein [Pisolithus orientalis]
MTANVLSQSSQVPTTDAVFLDSIQFTAAIGSDCWRRPKPQPVLASVYLYLHSSFLDACGTSDDVKDSVHYGHLAKAVSAIVGERERTDTPYTGVHALIQDITRVAFELAEQNAIAVRVVVDLPKQILLASGFSVDVTTPRAKAGEGGCGDRNFPASATICVRDLVLPVLIGVNPPERLARQRVITNITFYERPCTTSESTSKATVSQPQANEVDYTMVLQLLYEFINSTSYLTLEKLVLELIRACFRMTSPQVDAVTVRCEKPSAISFAHASGVQITRRREEVNIASET